MFTEFCGITHYNAGANLPMLKSPSACAKLPQNNSLLKISQASRIHTDAKLNLNAENYRIRGNSAF